jgi:hypothetical protein
MARYRHKSGNASASARRPVLEMGWQAARSAVAEMTTKWHLVVAVCFFMPITGALATAKAANVGFSGSALAIVLGAARFACAWPLQIAGAAVGSRMRQEPATRRTYAITLNVAALLWTAIAFALGMWVASIALRSIT